MDFSIIIPHRGSALGLWATVESCEIDLRGCDFNYNYVIVDNGEEKVTNDTQNVVHFLRKAGKLGEFIHHPEPLSPPSARQLGTKHATGALLFFFDNHCLVGRDYFKRALLDFKTYDMDMLHSSTVFYTGEFTHYHYALCLEKNFWATSSFAPQHNLKPYRIGAAGHGGFVVRRSVWEEVGGYWDGFVGYGGEEMYFDLKMALLGKKNWIDPRLVHYHHAGNRGYARHYTDDYFRNMMMCANIIGGNWWLNRVAFSFLSKYTRFGDPKKTIYNLAVEAEERSRKHARELAAKRLRTLDEQLRIFREQCIAID